MNFISFMAFIQKQSHQVNWRLLEFVNKMLVMVGTSAVKSRSYLKIYSKSGGHAPISAVHVILDNIASSFKVILGN